MLLFAHIFSLFMLARSSSPCGHHIDERDGRLVLGCHEKNIIDVADVKNMSTIEDFAQQVTKIDLSFNAIRRIEDEAFSEFRNTHKLDLSHNDISSLHEGAFNGLSKLVELNLGFNPMLRFEHEAYSPRLFRNTELLEKIILSGSNVSLHTSGWPIEALSNIRNLTTLMITGATKNALPIPGSLNQLTSLRSLEFIKTDIGYLANRHISSIANSTIDTLSFRGGVTKISGDTFNNLVNLKTLNLACNKYLGLSHVFDILSSSVNHGIDSVALDMTYASLELVGQEDADNGKCRSILPRLRRLTVRGCRITGFHSKFYKCSGNLEIWAIGLNSPFDTEYVPDKLKEVMDRLPPKQILLDFQYGNIVHPDTVKILTGCDENSDSFYQDTETVFPMLPPLNNILIPEFSMVNSTMDVPEELGQWHAKTMYQTDAHGCWHVFVPSPLRSDVSVCVFSTTRGDQVHEDT